MRMQGIRAPKVTVRAQVRVQWGGERASRKEKVECLIIHLPSIMPIDD